MADPVALGVKPPQVMTLGDMVNLARGAQAYQQEQQMNPLALQKAQMEIQQLQKMNPLAVIKATEEAKQQQIGTTQKQLELDTSHFNLAGNILSGLETRARALAKKGDSATALKELKAARAWMDASGIPYKAEGAVGQAEKQLQNNDFDGYLATLENMRNVLGSAPSRYQAYLPQVQEIGGVKYERVPATGELKQLGEEGAPKPTPTKGEELFKEDMRIAPGSVMQLNERQKARYDEGDKIQKDSIKAVESANEMGQSIRKIRETINSAKGSLTGQALRNAIKNAVGDAQYETLNKNLEDLYVRNVGVMGGDTDAARASIKTTLGNPDITKEALEGIIDRVEASAYGVKKFNQGFNNYAKKTSTENALVHARQFQQAWAENSDPLIFMAQASKDSTKSKAEKELFRQKVHKSLTDEQAAELKKKQKKINRLTEGERFWEDK